MCAHVCVYVSIVGSADDSGIWMIFRLVNL